MGIIIMKDGVSYNRSDRITDFRVNFQGNLLCIVEICTVLRFKFTTANVPIARSNLDIL